jgi:hypothetical protein
MESLNYFLKLNLMLRDARVARWFLLKSKSQFGNILECLRWENIDIIYVYFEYFMDIWDIL